MKLSVNDIGNKFKDATIVCPGYVKLKPASGDYNSLDPNVIYTFTAKGWDVKNNGTEIYKIDGFGWFPSSNFEVIKGIIPN